MAALYFSWFHRIRPCRDNFLKVETPVRQRRAIRGCLNVDGERKVSEGSVEKLGLGLKSKDVIEDERKVIVGTYARTPVVLVRGKGCNVFDAEGNAYLDLGSGIAVNALGHGDEDWIKAVSEQASVLTHVSNVYYNVPQVGAILTLE